MTIDDFPDTSLDDFLELVSAQTGLRFSEHRRPTAVKIVRQELQQSRFIEPDDFLNHINSDSDAFETLVGKLTIGETYFFRNPGQFDVIRTAVLPAIWNERGPRHRIRIWSAGCASGEEAYSLAMLLHDLDMIENSHVLATDISHESLAHARRGKYREWSLRGTRTPLLEKHLNFDGNEYSVDEKLKQHVVFEYLNLSRDTYPSYASGTWGLDLIVCRNVLIYFDRETIDQVGRRFFECLSPGGWLLLGASDPVISSAVEFETMMTHAGLAYRRPTSRPETAVKPADIEITDSDTVAGTGLENTVVIKPESIDTAVWTPTSQPAQAPEPESGFSIDAVESAFEQGCYETVIQQTREYLDNVKAASLHIRAIANLDTDKAEQACVATVKLHPVSAELLYLHSVLLLELDRDQDAADTARGVVFLDRNLAVAHLTLGTALQRLADVDGARRAFRNAYKICAARPADEVVPLSNGELAERLAYSALQHLSLLET